MMFGIHLELIHAAMLELVHLHAQIQTMINQNKHVQMVVQVEHVQAQKK